jgi:proline iminopeptidase
MRVDPARVAAFTAPAYAIAFARIESHYFQNGGFFQRDDHLLHRAAALADTRGVIIQGRYDICTPMSTAWDLHKAWPKAEFRVVADSGHALSEPGIVDALVSATEAFK